MTDWAKQAEQRLREIVAERDARIVALEKEVRRLRRFNNERKAA